MGALPGFALGNSSAPASGTPSPSMHAQITIMAMPTARRVDGIRGVGSKTKLSFNHLGILAFLPPSFFDLDPVLCSASRTGAAERTR